MNKARTNEKCREIVEEIVRRCDDINQQEIVVGFSPDWGGNSLTIHVAKFGHSHVGIPEDSFEQLVTGLHDLLCNGTGLSFHPGPAPETEVN